jgi:AcrR family transcriptional regulator
MHVVASVKKEPADTRKEKAAATRRRMLDAAYELLCEQGYRATTMEAIAEQAGVAVQTLYFTFHTKDELLQQVHDRTVLGDEGVPPPLQPWYRTAMAEHDLRTALRTIVEGTQTILARVAPMLPVFHTVAGEPAGAVWQRAEQLRVEGYDSLLRALETRQPLRQGLRHRDARDILFVVLGPETYRAFVHERQWSVTRWVRWTVDVLAQDLFGQ